MTERKSVSEKGQEVSGGARERLTDWQVAEMVAIKHAQDALGHGTSLAKFHWSSYRPLVRRGLVTWKTGGAAWGPDFREVALTPKGLNVLAAIPNAEEILEAEMAKHQTEHEDAYDD